ncbi:hypothetical protein BDA99DRAFT_183349 [Phascolomyces articulosus]|uniref:Endoplasmic reticulum junction formation protein lunapark n=1 Tax=Phascolomyces articulosus TaxID=60185 RepID=A0AAD5PAD3_9FUNG|nr:hypothetical protein BDA99DRAFT_183349 [Phascolomyces articulosus]
MWVIYSTIIWVVYSFYCFVALRNASQRDFEGVVLLTAPVIACPVGIYYIRQLLRRIFAWSQNRIDLQLQTLRAEQKLKLDELKKKTAYYSTQSLIDRYDEEHKRQQKQKQTQQIPQHNTSKGAPPLPSSSTLGVPQQQQPMNKPPTINVPTRTAAPPPRQPQWYDRVLDAMVGDAGPESKFALICNYCFAHNGLVLPQEMDTIQYICPNCKKFNSSRKSRQLHPDGPVVPPSPAPSMTSRLTDGDQEVKGELYGKETPDIKNEQDEEEDANETIASRVRRRHQHEHKDLGLNDEGIK